MYIQSLVKYLAMFCIVLMVCIPASIAVEVSGPKLVEGLVGDKGGFADFSIIQKYYEPRPLTSSTIEKTDAPVFVHLAAIPATPMSVPRICRGCVSVREVGTHVLTGGVEYRQPILLSWDDFGTLIVRLKRIPKEKDVPDTIIANLTATFRYETAIMPGLIGGAVSTTLTETKRGSLMKKEDERDVFDLDKISAEGYKFFGGYIVAVDIGKDRVRFIVFNEAGEPSPTSVSKGEESRLITLVLGSKRLQDQVRVRVDNIEKNEVAITLLAGTRRGESEVNFKLIIPVDKRPFDLTPKEIQNHIEWTNETIEWLDGLIEDMDEYVDWFYSACLISTALVVVSQFFGIGRVATAGDKGAGAVTKAATEPEAPPGFGAAILDVTGGATVPQGATHKYMDFYYKVNTDNTVSVHRDGKWVDSGFKADEIGHFHKLEVPSVQPTTVPQGGTTGTVGKTIYTDYFKGERLIVVPVHDFSKLPKNLFPIVHQYKNQYKNRIYAAYSDKKGLTFYVLNGREIDASTKIGEDPIDDPLTQTYRIDSSQYRTFTIEMRNVQRALFEGKTKNVHVFGDDYELIGKNLLADEAALNCEEYMSPGQCKIIFNFCDPVICPPSRCNFGGTYRLADVRESGLFASTFACMANFPEVYVPVCLSGIKDSLENIRSYIQSYQRCLQIKLKEGRSVGFCDMARSVFMCELIWKHVLDPFFGYLGNKILSRRGKGQGGGEYTGVRGAIPRAKRAGKYFVEGYAKQIIASYKGKVGEAIGTELCRSAVVGKFPNFGEIVKEIAEGGKPTQYTARFEEHPYAAGKSRYYGYYHIYVGSKTETVNYAVYLKGCGEMERLDVGQAGVIKGGDFADETFEQIGPQGCKHICLIIDGENKCAFGKVLSSSYAVDRATEGYVARQAGRNITSERECVPAYEAYLGAAVNRQCAVVQPLQPGEKWINVGTCREGVICWAEISTKDVEARIKTECVSLGGKEICDKNEICEGENKVTITGSDKVCCKVKCKAEKETPTEAPPVTPTAPLTTPPEKPEEEEELLIRRALGSMAIAFDKEDYEDFIELAEDLENKIGEEKFYEKIDYFYLCDLAVSYYQVKKYSEAYTLFTRLYDKYGGSHKCHGQTLEFWKGTSK